MAKLGSDRRPIRAHVRTMDRAQEIVALCDARGWQVIVGVEPDKAENITELERLLNPPAPALVAVATGRNEPCSCGSGKKYKKCCLGAQL